MSPKYAPPAELYRTFRAWLMSKRSIESLRCALTFCTGTLLCMVPGYASLWSSSLSLADQISFTLLGGVSKPVGGCWEQIFNRLGGGVVFGTPCYIILALLERQYTTQALLLAIFIFSISWLGSYSKFLGSGALFAQTACIYAVTNSYRYPHQYHLQSLWDLLMCWVFGAAICLFYNLVFFPTFASTELVRHIDRSLSNIKDAVDYLYSDSHTYVDGRALNDRLTADIDTSAILLNQSSWEITYQAPTQKDLRVVVETLDRLRVVLFTSVLDRCAYRMLKPDTAALLRQPMKDCQAAYYQIIEATRADLRGQASGSTTCDPAEDLKSAYSSFAAASSSLNEKMLQSLSTVAHANIEEVSHLYVATHCISLARPLAEHLEALHVSTTAFAHRSKTWQFRLFDGILNLRSYMPSPGLVMLFRPSSAPGNAFLPTPSIAQRIMRVMTTDQAIGALKVMIALIAMMCILWADESRAWFLQKNVQTATVPLILALMPTLGGSMLAWIAELLGTLSGAIWGFITMLVWRNVGGAAFSAPGVIFFQMLYTLCLSWRLAWGCDDMLAVLGCFALGAFINKEFQLRHTDPPQSLVQQLGTSAIVISIAIGLAIPMQFLVMRKNARQSCRLALASSMRDVASVHESVSKVFTHLLLDEKFDQTQVAVETASLRRAASDCRRELLALRGLVKEAKAEWATHDGWLAERYIRQIAACQRMLATSDIAARILSMGPFDPQVRQLISPNFATAAADFSGSSSSVMWCHAAALSLLRPLPGTLPSVEQTMRSVFVEVAEASKQAALLDISNEQIESDLRRFWQLSHLLISQAATLEELHDLLRVDWKPRDEVEVESPEGKLEAVLSRKESLLATEAALPVVSK